MITDEEKAKRKYAVAVQLSRVFISATSTTTKHRTTLHIVKAVSGEEAIGKAAGLAFKENKEFSIDVFVCEEITDAIAEQEGSAKNEPKQKHKFVEALGDYDLYCGDIKAGFIPRMIALSQPVKCPLCGSPAIYDAIAEQESNHE